jgi:hypothetical protein
MTYSSVDEYVSKNVGALQREGISVIEMQTVLLIVYTSTAERVASKFVTLKTKHLATQTLEDGYEAECKKIYQHVERLYTSCLEDLNM